MENKKILIAIPCLLLGGTEYQTLNLVRALRDSAYSVAVLCYFEHDPRMVAYMRDSGAEVMLMSPDGNRPIGLRATISALFSRFRRALKSYRPDVVHVQYMAPGSLAILLFKLLGVKKLIATAHTPGHIYRRKWIPQLLSRYTTDLFLCVSQSSEEAFFETAPHLYTRDLHQSGRKHFTLYNCTDIPDSPMIQTPSHPLTIGVVSRLSREKGIDRLVEAAPMILEKYPETRFLIVGDGGEKNALQTQAEHLGVEHAFTWTGLQPKEALMGYYTQMDIVAIPSRFEGFGLTAIEAMSYALPVVASRVDGLMEVIEDGVSGVLTDCTTADQLAVALVALLDNPSRAIELGKNGYKRVKATFAYNIYQKTIANIYTQLIRGD